VARTASARSSATTWRSSRPGPTGSVRASAPRNTAWDNTDDAYRIQHNRRRDRLDHGLLAGAVLHRFFRAQTRTGASLEHKTPRQRAQHVDGHRKREAADVAAKVRLDAEGEEQEYVYEAYAAARKRLAAGTIEKTTIQTTATKETEHRNGAPTNQTTTPDMVPERTKEAFAPI
jgi:hypothetical protein